MQIEKTIPAPDALERVSRVQGQVKASVDAMQVGDSVLVNVELARCIRARLVYCGKLSRQKKDSESGLMRVWRVA